MAKKDKQGRITIPRDLFVYAGFLDFKETTFGFYVTNDSRVAITHLSIAKKLGYELLSTCRFWDINRVSISANIDDYLGPGDYYYFTSSLVQKEIYLYKLDTHQLCKRQELQIQKLLASL